MADTDLYYCYSQIAVFSPVLSHPFNDWSDRQVRQGFAWRRHSVSFRMLNEEGQCRVSVKVGSTYVPNPSAKRALVVPFDLDGSEVEIGSITDSRRFEVPPGQYALYFEVGEDEKFVTWALLSFVPQATVDARILVEDQGISPEYPLDMAAKPAGIA